MPATELEPVRPDPKKLWRTAIVLVIIMIVGGIVILKAYEKRMEEGETDKRPSFVTQISDTKDLTYIRQDGKITDLNSLKGKVIVVQSLAKSQPEEMTTGAMQRLSENYKDRSDLALVTLMLDPGPADDLQEELEILAGKIGAELPQWTVASNEGETLHRFIKNEFKASMLPYEEDGKWNYDQSLVLIDRNRHVRRAVVPQKRGGASHVASFDFEQAKEWDDGGLKTGVEKTNVEQMEILLNDTIEILLNEKDKP